jgi:hypothetical protein
MRPLPPAQGKCGNRLAQRPTLVLLTKRTIEITYVEKSLPLFWPKIREVAQYEADSYKDHNSLG